MFEFLFLVFTFPLLGFLTLAIGRQRISENAAAYIGVGSVGLSALLTAIIGWQFYHQPAGFSYTQELWTWMSVGDFSPRFALRLDQLSMLMMCVICGVGFFIHLFASWYMRGDEAYPRFFAYMNLFVTAMLFLVLGDNLLFLYFGWEGVGLASYLLIGFWYQDAANGAAARKSFIITRVGDTFMAIGLFIIFHGLGTLNIQDAMSLAPQKWAEGGTMVTAAALLLLGGAVGKSAQLPLQTWLPDAMAGPTPVSALIHAATMVTAGVYLIARTHVLFELSPFALDTVGWIGGITLLLAGFTALTQTDIKKILAYSTMSQIGYMFLALGAGAYQPAVFHLMTHAFFKALLFLSAGSVILACHHEQDIFKMGGLRKKIPFTFWVFLIGSLGLVAFPLTSGFFSKDKILFEAWAYGHHAFYWMGLGGAFLTGLYTFRLIFIAFFGESRATHDAHAHDDHGHGGEITQPKGGDHTLPLAVLAVAALFGGWIHIPLDAVLPQPAISEAAEHVEYSMMAASVGVSFLGIFLAWFFFLKNPALAAGIKQSAIGQLLFRWWRAAFGFDWLYDLLFVKPYLFIVRLIRRDVADQAIGLLPRLTLAFNSLFSNTQTGQLRWYAGMTAAGAVVVIAAVILI
ncbi:NADH-quinone oxidoreductase subunit L [Solimonas marina]|uniref:NADH-quinone oxidoreductase subunit L n=1 Tax=Solimonas marina TaxID=2714601 RepID=A0A969W8Y8_9GAMM|nr:NADH-quinone oxidoreductase subunit L [Solimonas marina]NKF22183.1 NADH-quinone oxidoreductase subunit L [Solimonas marina]